MFYPEQMPFSAQRTIGAFELPHQPHD